MRLGCAGCIGAGAIDGESQARPSISRSTTRRFSAAAPTGFRPIRSYRALPETYRAWLQSAADANMICCASGAAEFTRTIFLRSVRRIGCAGLARFSLCLRSLSGARMVPGKRQGRGRGGCASAASSSFDCAVVRQQRRLSGCRVSRARSMRVLTATLPRRASRRANL